MIDPMKAARLHREIRSSALRKQAHQAHIAHNVSGKEALDPSLSNRRVYGGRADWYASAAVNGLFDVDCAVDVGLRRYPVAAEIGKLANGKRKTGMSLYE